MFNQTVITKFNQLLISMIDIKCYMSQILNMKLSEYIHALKLNNIQVLILERDYLKKESLVEIAKALVIRHEQ